jgi:hypothetical protein
MAKKPPKVIAGGSDVRSPVYPNLGDLKRRYKKVGFKPPIRGRRQGSLKRGSGR